MIYADEQNILNTIFNAALSEDRAAMEKLRPFYLVRPRLYRDGNEWCALYGDDIQTGVCSFGKSPAKAALAFDKAWNTDIQTK